MPSGRGMTKKQIKAMFEAIEARKVDEVLALLRSVPEGANAIGTGKPAFEGKTALMFAAQCASADLMAAMIELGADVKAVMVGGLGWPVLHFAVRAAMNLPGQGHDRLVTMLLDKGADPNQPDPQGNTALDRAVLDYTDRTDNWRLLEILVAAGAKRCPKAARLPVAPPRFSADACRVMAGRE